MAGKYQGAKLCRQAGADSAIDLRVVKGSLAHLTGRFKFPDNQERPQSTPHPEIVSQV